MAARQLGRSRRALLLHLVGQRLSERLGQQFVVENRPGAAGNLATEAVVRAPPDGYTVLLANGANAVSATLYEKLSFDFIRDIAPVASIAGAALVMVTNLSFPAKTVPEFIAYAKANPGKINMAVAGGGASTPFLAGELFKGMTGVEWVWVQYRGEYMPDLISGQVQAAFTVIPRSIDYIRTGQLRALAVTSAAHLEVLPTSPPSMNLCRATRPAVGLASAHRRAHPRRLSKNSTRRLMPSSPNPI